MAGPHRQMMSNDAYRLLLRRGLVLQDPLATLALIAFFRFHVDYFEYHLVPGGARDRAQGVMLQSAFTAAERCQESPKQSPVAYTLAAIKNAYMTLKKSAETEERNLRLFERMTAHREDAHSVWLAHHVIAAELQRYENAAESSGEPTHVLIAQVLLCCYTDGYTQADSCRHLGLTDQEMERVGRAIRRGRDNPQSPLYDLVIRIFGHHPHSQDNKPLPQDPIEQDLERGTES